ncbi:MAG: hypothetical protein FWH21_07070 [Kiritimatiellaeota bacterium]|nr:hypothetical protein [Kiritimatiellota bacterium]
MKKVLVGCMLALVFAFGAGAAEEVRWPVWFSWGDDRDIDIIGLRMSAGGRCEQVTGIDLGLIGRSRYFNGIQFNLCRCEVEDALAGWQISLGYNSVGMGHSVGLQVGLWNEAETTFDGFQVGLVNLTSYARGFQVGLINRADDLHGFQVGLVNVIRNSTVQFCPIVNIGF